MAAKAKSQRALTAKAIAKLDEKDHRRHRSQALDTIYPELIGPPRITGQPYEVPNATSDDRADAIALATYAWDRLVAGASQQEFWAIGEKAWQRASGKLREDWLLSRRELAGVFYVLAPSHAVKLYAEPGHIRRAQALLTEGP